MSLWINPEILTAYLPLVVTLVTVVVLEQVACARPALAALAPEKARHRAIGIVTLLASGTILTRLALPAGLTAVAVWAGSTQFGLFSLVGLPRWVEVALAWVLLDLAIWAQHVAMHKTPVLWRLHRVHHGDTTMDVLTAFRFHPLELLVSLAWKAAVVVVLGAPVEAVVLFATGLSAAAMINHANIALPEKLDQILSRVFATPAFHLIHHHPEQAWTDSHYGNVLSIWDHLAGLGGQGPDGPVQIGLDSQVVDNGPVALLVEPWRR
jgi:sterol desaturase/sphingolipid hydroxylase (fatty acid hydroxylase superfamily)